MQDATQVKLTDDERRRLSLVTDVQHDDCYETTEPGTCALDGAVEEIVAHRLAVARLDWQNEQMHRGPQHVELYAAVDGFRP